MAELVIRIYGANLTDPLTTVSIPAEILRITSNLIPKAAKESLRERGIELEEIAKLADNPDAHGVIMTVEEHAKGEKVVISIE